MYGPALDVKGGISALENLILEADTIPFEVEVRGTMRDTSIAARITLWIWQMVTIPWRAIRRRPKIVHIHFSHSISTPRKIAIALAWRLFGAKVVLHAHSSDYEIFWPRIPFFLRWMVRFAFRRAHRFVVLSESWACFYRDSCGVDEDRIVIMPTPIRVERNPREPTSPPTQILFSGRIGNRKGTFDLIQAFAGLATDVRENGRLVLCGDGEVDKARKMASDLGLEKLVRITGWVSDDERDRLLRESHVYCLPSRNEGLPMGLLEAMGNALAVVTTPVGGIPEVVTDGENGLMVEPGDVRALGDCLNRLLTDPEERRRLAKAGHVKSMQHDIDVYTVRLVETWQSLVGD